MENIWKKKHFKKRKISFAPLEDKKEKSVILKLNARCLSGGVYKINVIFGISMIKSTGKDAETITNHHKPTIILLSESTHPTVLTLVGALIQPEHKCIDLRVRFLR